MLMIGLPVFIITHKIICKYNQQTPGLFTNEEKRFWYWLLSLDWASVASQSVHRSVILFGLFHAATAAHLYVIFAELNLRCDRREKKRTI
jgi:hypothetical protein